MFLSLWLSFDDQIIDYSWTQVTIPITLGFLFDLMKSPTTWQLDSTTTWDLTHESEVKWSESGLRRIPKH